MISICKYLLVWMFVASALSATVPGCPITSLTDIRGGSGPTLAQLKVMPYAQIRSAYLKSEHPETIQFVEENQAVIVKALCEEAAAAPDAYVTYYGMNGRRLFYDTLRRLYEAAHKKAMPEDFFLFADPQTSIYDTTKEVFLKNTFPGLSVAEKRLVLQALLEDPKFLTDSDVVKLWEFLHNDPNELEAQLTDAMRWQLANARKRSPAFDASRDTVEGDVPAPKQVVRWAIAFEHIMHDAANREMTPQARSFVNRLSALSGGKELMARFTAYDGVSDDHAPDVRRRVLPVNFSLFGSCVYPDRTQGLAIEPGECTLFFWRHPLVGSEGHLPKDVSREPRLMALLKAYGLGKSDEDRAQMVVELEQIYQTLRPEDDHLLIQILIPKDKIDDIMYVSRPYARPISLNEGDNERVKVSELLDAYARNAADIPLFFHFQGRIIFTRKGLLNPYSGIKMHLYLPHNASQERVNRYLDQLNAWVSSKK